MATNRPVRNDPVDVDAVLSDAEEVNETNSVPQNPFASIDINALVAEQVKAALAQERQNATTNSVVENTRAGDTYQPPKYLKHYRHDLAPDKWIAKRTVNGDGSLGPIHKGEYLKFRRGHFFAMLQEEVDQIEWMRSHPQFDPRDSSRVVGGDPAIYENDGKDLIKCQFCDEYFVAGSNSYKSHKKAAHGIE
jgi:hypothetical protein